jgi:hypothetical protein
MSMSRVDDYVRNRRKSYRRRGQRVQVKKLAGGIQVRSTGSFAKGLSDGVVTVVSVIAGHALACEGVGGSIPSAVGHHNSMLQ